MRLPSATLGLAVAGEDHDIDDNRVSASCPPVPALLSGDYVGHSLTFQQFAQTLSFARVGAVYRNFDFEGPVDLVKSSAGLSGKILGGVAGLMEHTRISAGKAGNNQPLVGAPGAGGGISMASRLTGK